MRNQVGRSHRLIEVMAVLSCLAVTAALLVPGVSFVGEQGRRRVCMSNLRRLGQACHIYAQDDPGVFPAIGVTTGLSPSTASDGQMDLFDPAVRTSEPSTTGVPSPTVDMWALLRANLASSPHFICPSTPDTPDPVRDASAYFDFLAADHLSYAYQYQHDPNRAIIGRGSEPTFPVMADGNPYIKGSVALDLTQDRNAAERGNSTNHPNRQGQNILFQAGHVFFLRSPDVGLPGQMAGLGSSRGRDNCYTTVANEGANVDPGNLAPVVYQAESGGLAGRCNLGSRSDACLVP